MLLFSLLLFSRMFFLQVIEGEKYQTKAENNRISLRQIAPSRGLFLTETENRWRKIVKLSVLC